MNPQLRESHVSVPPSERVHLGVIVAALAAIYIAYSLFRHWRFGSAAYDLGIFDQVMWHLSRFEAPSSTVRGYANAFGDHMSPILLALVPAYWLAPRAETLLIVQAVLMALAAVPVYRFSRRRMPHRPALMLTLAFGLFWGMQRAVAFDFHETAFAPLAIAWAIDALDRWKPLEFWPLMIVIMSIREDLIPLAACFGLLMCLQRHRTAGLLLFGGGMAVFALVIGVVMPALSGTSTYGYSRSYAHLGQTPLEIPVAAVLNPWRFVTVLVSPPAKLLTVLLWLGPFLFLPLRSPLGLLLIPVAASRLLSETPYHWGPNFHYSAPLAPILAMAAADAIARLRPMTDRTRYTPHVVTAVILIICAIVPGRLPAWRVLAPRHYEMPEHVRTGYHALAAIPEDASVTAQAAIVPHISNRAEIYVLDAQAPRTEFVVVARRLTPWPLESVDELFAIVNERFAEYRPVFDQQGWLVLRRP